MTPAKASSNDGTAVGLAMGAIAIVTAIRCAVLVLSPLNLYPDEAQYWWWAQAPDLGYFSKPPMIAWIIWLSTGLLGQSEWAIRIASPLLHAATALMVFVTARRGLDARLSALSAFAYVTVPGVSYSSGLISTDVPLLFFWAVALYAFLGGCEDTRWRWPLLCGVALGLGLLSKYAMLYFFAGAFLAALFSRPARRFVFSMRGLAVLAAALILLAPNIVWNATHGFPTVAHTEANADWSRPRFSLASAAGFVLGQFGVFGPLLIVGWLGALMRLVREAERSSFDILLAAFSLPPVVLVLIQSFVAGANANWAATAFVAATPLAVAELASWWRGRPLWASFVIDCAAMLALWVVLVWPAAANAVGVGNAFKREEGWRELGAAVAREAGAGRYDAIAGDNRSIVAELLYYTPFSAAHIRMWAGDLAARNHFEMTLRLAPATGRVLLAIDPTGAGRVLATFDSARLLKHVVIAVGGGRTRAINLYDARNYRGPQAMQS